MRFVETFFHDQNEKGRDKRFLFDSRVTRKYEKSLVRLFFGHFREITKKSELRSARLFSSGS